MKFGIGEYVTRDGRKAVVTKVMDDLNYPLVGNIGGDYMSWNQCGHIWRKGMETCGDLISPWQSYQYEGKEVDMTMTDEFKEAAQGILDEMHGKPGRILFEPNSPPKFTACTSTGLSNVETNTLHDKIFRAALTGLIYNIDGLTSDEINAVVKKSYAIADEAMKQRSE
jgi:hypothetical protein